MAGARVTFEEWKSILKWYIKFENVAEVQRQWKREWNSRFHWRWTLLKCVYIFLAGPLYFAV
jgi:hypothetical protein